MTEAMIETGQLNKSYGGKRGIVDVSLRVEPGDVFGFLGPNGAGKTTTIRILMALLRADSGSARIDGLDCWSDSVAIKRVIGYMPAEPALDGNLTGGQLLEYLGHLRGGVDQAYLRQLVDRFELDPTRKFRQYSSGNKRKVVLIQAFMHRPRVLILDEPTSGLDPLNQQEFRRLVVEARQGGATAFVSSHVLSEVEEMCTRVGIIRDGRVVRIGGIHDVKDIKRSELTILFASTVPLDVFTTLPDVETAESTAGGQGVHLTVKGPPDAAIKAAARYDIVSVTSHEPSLEDIFLRYYGGVADAAADGASEQVA
ncbi:MAG: ABC transporter ATP-binding protein [Candidatus Dormibacteraeota bacterium]|nr:ABC transporter ATP-binding protein [Candidatus Dormibacteraeota bacterium]